MLPQKITDFIKIAKIKANKRFIIFVLLKN